MNEESYNWDRQERLLQHVPPEERTPEALGQIARLCRAEAELDDESAAPDKIRLNGGGSSVSD